MRMNILATTGASCLAMAVALVMPAAHAQTVAAAPVAEEPAIVVTGTRISRPEVDLPTPIETLTSENIEKSGETNLTEFLLDSPALSGSLSSEGNSGSNTGAAAVGLNLLELRNLGSQRTLVLVNGRRHVNAYAGESSVDTNTIPLALLERVDVLTGGASAVYGADAVSGVVNFILKRSFSGLEARGQVGISERGDAGNRLGSIAVGTNFADDRGNIALAYEYNISDQLSQRARAYTGRPADRFELVRNQADFPDNPNVPDRVPLAGLGWADSAPGGAVDVDLDFVPDFEGNGSVYRGGTFLRGGGGRSSGSLSDTPTAGYFGDFLPFLERHNANALFSFEFSDKLRLTAEAKYVRTRARTEAQPTFDFYTYLPFDNAYLNQRFGAAAPDGAFVTRDNFDFGTRNQKATRDTYRAVVGIDGQLTEGAGSGNLRYDIAYVYGRADSRVTDTNQRIVDRYYAALDAVVNPANGQITCRINLPGETTIDPNNYAGIQTIGGVPVTGAPLTFQPGQCVPLNILGEGAPSRAALNFILADDITNTRSTQNVFTAAINGDLGFLFDLPGGPMKFALGGEYRKEEARYVTSALSQLGAFDGGAKQLPSGGSYDVVEAFGELSLPIFRNAPFMHLLEVSGAARVSEYSTIGQTFTWKVDGVWAPVRDLRFRATLAQAVRAPNTTELFSPLQGVFNFLDDPCDVDNLSEGTANRAANCRTQLAAAGLTPAQIAGFSPSTDPQQSTSQAGFSGGNPNLSEETARTWTAGVAFTPTFIPRLSITADWYNIRIRDAINTPPVNEVFELCVDQPSLQNSFCDSFTRAPGTGFINNYTVRTQNVASFDTAGLEAKLNYRMPLGDSLGSLNIRAIGAYLDKLVFVPTIGGVPVSQRNFPSSPKYQASLDLGWTMNKVAINYGLAWQSKTRRFSQQTLDGNPDISDPRYFKYKQRWEHDINVSYDVTDEFRLWGGINNFTDQQPDFAALAGIPVSPVGRYFYVGARIKLARD